MVIRHLDNYALADAVLKSGTGHLKKSELFIYLFSVALSGIALKLY